MKVRNRQMFLYTYSHCHTVVFLDGTATSQESDDEDDAAQADGHDWQHGLGIVGELCDGSKVGQHDGTESNQQYAAYLE